VVEPLSAPSPLRSPEGPLLVRIGTALGLSAAAALACALPAALRVSSAGGGSGANGTAHAWVALAAAELVPMMVAVLVLRGAREGLRAFTGEGAVLRAWGIGLWVAVQFVALATVGAALRVTTHQHALAGVTYAFAAFFVAAGSALACARVVAILHASSERSRRLFVVAFTVLALLAVGVVGMRFVRAVWREPTPSAAAATVIDVLAFALAALFASRPSFAPRRALAILGLPAAVALAVLGVPARRDPALRGAVEDRAPLLAPLVDGAPRPGP
jgi:hypothetical protein